MTAVGNGSNERVRAPRRTPRSIIGAVLAVLLMVSTVLAATLMWTDHYVFNAQRFAARADLVLDSDAVREVLADEVTTAVVQAGPSEIASFQAVIRPVVQSVVGAPAFRSVFRSALVQAHDYLFTRHGNAAIVNLSQALGVLSASLQVSNPDVANMLPTNSDQFLVDLGNDIRGLHLWTISRTVSDYGWVFLALTTALAIATIVVDSDRRRGAFRLGMAVAVAGALMFALALVAPMIAGSYANTSEVERALRDATTTFLADYRTGAIWLVGIGVAIAACSTASVPHTAPLTFTAMFGDLRTRVNRLSPTTSRTRLVSAIAMILAGGAIVIWTETFLYVAALAVAATLLYMGAVRLLSVVGRSGEPARRTEIEAAVDAELASRSWHPHTVRVVLGTVAILAVLVVGGLWATSGARAKAVQNDQRRCNGHASLCDKRLDEVAFAGSHNSMSVATDPGWLFFEQGHSIPAQLEDGIRALLVKTHYGIRTSIRLTGTDMVVTDKAAELAVNPITDTADYTPEQLAQLARLSSSVQNVDPNLRDVYLCHVNCEFGATKFTTALGYVRQFLARNPNEVVLLFVGDYVSRADTEKAFRDAKLFDRLWQYDPNQPMPTLGELIDSGRNVVYLSEFVTAADDPPAWDVPGYGIFQDDPYTYRTTEQLLTPGAPGYTGTATVTGPVNATTIPPSATAPVFTKDWTGLPSCAPNRGTPASPLFQINHWVTPAGAPPTVDQARIVNASAVLLPAVRNCMTQRSLFPTIIGVNFAEVGDLQRVVAEINGVGKG